MADKKITDLNVASSPVDTDLIEIVQNVPASPDNFKLSWLALKTALRAFFDTLYSTASLIVLRVLGTPTYTSIQNWNDLMQSAGVIEGGVVTDGGGGTIDISELKGIIKATDSVTGENSFFDLAGITGQALTDQVTNYIAVDYNSGVPQFIVTLTDTSNGHTIFALYKVFKETTVVDIIKTGLSVVDFSRRVQEHHNDEDPLHFTEGAVIGEVATRFISISAGILYSGLNRIPTPSIDTSGADIFEYHYFNGSVWIEVDASLIDNLQFNDIASGLVTLGNGKYGVHWVYKGTNSTTFVIYGQASYTLTDAQDAEPPASIPDHVNEFGVLRGKIIINKSASVFEEIQGVEDNMFTPISTNDHSQLSNLDFSNSNHTGFAPTRPVTEKTTLVNGDEITGNNSADSFSQIRTTWTNVKIFLLAFFDNIYQTIISGSSFDNVTPEDDDLVMIQDISNSKILKTVTAKSIADLGGGGGVGAIAKVITPLPTQVLNGTIGEGTYDTNTKGYTISIDIPFEITVNSIDFRESGSPSVAGTAKIGIYSEDGQTKHIDVTTPNITTNIIYHVPVSAVTLPAGRYYFVFIPIGTANLSINKYTMFGVNLGDTGEPVLIGTQTVTAGTLPATFDPSSDVSFSNSEYAPFIRLNN